MDRPLVPARLSRGSRGAVVSPHELASGAGLAILRAGGNAVDAAIATNAALAVVASSMCGLGGDAFWLIWPSDADPRLYALNGSGRSPRGATLEAAAAAGPTGMPVRGPWTVTVPGAVRSWGDAHARFGRSGWSDLLEPAIELADGFPATDGWVGAVERAATVYGVDSDWARVFRARHRPSTPGEMVHLPALAGSLRRLAGEGPDTLYTGALAARAAAYLASRGSLISPEDLADHRSDWGEPIATDYRGVTAYSHPPNSCGPIALELLAILAVFEPPGRHSFGPHGPTDAAWVHSGLEAARLTLADRDRYLTDPEAMPRDALATLLDPAHARQLAREIDPQHVRLPAPLRTPVGGGTVYLATADRWGGVVSLIESNYAGFGSGLVDPETGIAYQNRGAFFSLDPRHANAFGPRKRTMHTLTPGMLFRAGRPWIVHGSMGGEIQPQVFAQFVSAVVDGGLDVAAAVAVPRWAADVEEHHGPPSLTVLEPRFAAEVAAGLETRGHRVRWAEPFDSGLGHEHAIEIVAPPEGDDARPTFAAGADPRSEGLAAAW